LKLKYKQENHTKERIRLISGYSQPLPLARDMSICQKDPSQRYRLFQAIKMKRELSIQAMIGFNPLQYALDTQALRGAHEGVKSRPNTLPAVSKSRAGTEFYYNHNEAHNIGEKDSGYKPLKNILRTPRVSPTRQLEEDSYVNDRQKSVKFTLSLQSRGK
jgi:hypothetical protein